MSRTCFAIHMRPSRAEGYLVRRTEGTAKKNFVKIRHAFEFIRNYPGTGRVSVAVLDPSGAVIAEVEVKREG